MHWCTSLSKYCMIFSSKQMQKYGTFLYNWITQFLNLSVQINVEFFFFYLMCVFLFVASYLEQVFVLESHFHVFCLQSNGGQKTLGQRWGGGKKFQDKGGWGSKVLGLQGCSFWGIIFWGEFFFFLVGDSVSHCNAMNKDDKTTSLTSFWWFYC